MKKTVNTLLQNDLLVKLIQKDNFVGRTYSINYDRALVITNDEWKEQANGVPHNCFLVAASFDPENYQEASPLEKEVILLRVIGSAELPQEGELIQTKIDNIQHQEDIDDGYNLEDYDDITKNLLQYGGLECSILGTFYMKDNELKLGSDLESFYNSAQLRVYRPQGEALETIVNYIDPIKQEKAQEDAEKRGITEPISPFKLGTVRYTSTDRLHRDTDEEKVSFKIQPSDFLARRTAVLGMTRTGKSNTVKHTVSVVKKVADQADINIGQIIYDVNGEYANPNQQDEGAISEVYDDTICYRLFYDEDNNFRGLLNNFYKHINQGVSIIKNEIRKNYAGSQSDVQTFLSTSFEKPSGSDGSSYQRWKFRVAAYKAMLKKAGFDPGKYKRVWFKPNSEIIEAVRELAESEGETIEIPNEDSGIELEQAIKWFEYARKANRIRIEEGRGPFKTNSGNDWFDPELLSIVRMLAGKNSRDQDIKGYQLLYPAKKYHDPKREGEVGDEIYQHLENGGIVIIDLSVGDPTLRDTMSEKVALHIFEESMKRFINDDMPPNIIFYIEEAHNLIGKDDELTDTWPRIAKEGAKYEIGLVYATQEVSSIHPNILANTENWFVSHLNNKKEIRELIQFYDFKDFERSLLQADDVGFTRVKTLSSPFVVPVQIDKFDPEAAKENLSD